MLSQDSDNRPWTPRDGNPHRPSILETVVTASAGDNPSDSVDLVRVMNQLRDERIIVPSKQFMKMVQEGIEPPVAQRAYGGYGDGDVPGSSSSSFSRAQPMRHNASTAEGKPRRLLVKLLDDLMEFCELKLLDDEPPAPKERRGSKSFSNRASSDQDVGCEKAGDTSAMEHSAKMSPKSPTAESSPEELRAARRVAAARAAAKQTQMDALMSRCAHTYAQLLLSNSESSGAQFSRRARKKRDASARRQGEGAGDSSGAEDSRKGHSQSPPRSRVATDWSSDTNRAANSVAPMGRTGAASKLMADESTERQPSPGTGKKTKTTTTPFFEAVYALISRAVQQSVRAAADNQGLAQQKGGTAQLNARVEEELGCIFRSRDFGRRSGGSKQKGKQDGLGGGSEVESAQLAARAEDKLGKLIKLTSQIATKLNQDVLELEATIPCHGQDESSKPGAEGDKPVGASGAESKEAVAAAGDHATTSASVDALIEGFKSRAPPRRRPADQAVALQRVVGTRSPMMEKLLPSPQERRASLAQRMKITPRGERGRSLAIAGTVVQQPVPKIHEMVDEMVEPKVALRNSWALSRDRRIHRPEEIFSGVGVNAEHL